MTDSPISTRVQRRIRLMAAATIASAAPLSVTPSGMQLNDACASTTVDGSCCEYAAICGLNGINYPGKEWKKTCSVPK